MVEESELDKGKCSWLCISFAKQEIRAELSAICRVRQDLRLAS